MHLALSGTPVDCVYLGILKLCDRLPAVVVSGVNEGYNLGSDVFYSGTVAAAVEGALRGAAGIACSLAPRAKDPDRAIRFAAAVVRAAVAEPIPVGTVLNVNMPGTPTDGYQWTVIDSGSQRPVTSIDGAGNKEIWLGTSNGGVLHGVVHVVRRHVEDGCAGRCLGVPAQGRLRQAGRRQPARRGRERPNRPRRAAPSGSTR